LTRLENFQQLMSFGSTENDRFSLEKLPDGPASRQSRTFSEKVVFWSNSAFSNRPNSSNCYLRAAVAAPLNHFAVRSLKIPFALFSLPLSLSLSLFSSLSFGGSFAVVWK